MGCELGTAPSRRHLFRRNDEARLAVFDYSESFYNPIRSHGAPDYLSPDEHEAAYHQRRKEQATKLLAETGVPRATPPNPGVLRRVDETGASSSRPSSSACPINSTADNNYDR